ncbi:hypothetical protein G7046_g1284 [Stylonectria norvegica]|nr:hypothetical protein G7046_g1284 [Stylonectria norvegica]
MSHLRASAANDSDPFIITTSLDKPDPKTRKFIRSHVMRGKNTRRARFIKQLAREDAEQSPRALEVQAIMKRWIPTHPRKVASELFGLDALTTPYMHDLIYRAFAIIVPSTYTIENTLVEGSHQDLFCLSNLSRHPAMVHSLIFTTQAFHDMSVGPTYGKEAQFHLSKTLYYLQESLNDSELAISNSTMAIVTSLATAAVMVGELDTAKKHMDGLYRIVQLRGGLKSLGEGSMTEHKAQRIDLGLAMGIGSTMRFFPKQKSISWSYHLLHGKSANQFAEINKAYPRPDPKLLTVWADLSEFSKTVNDAAESGNKIPAEYYGRLSSAVPQRLLSLQFDPYSMHELLRLSMLAYMKGILVQIDNIGKKLRYLVVRLKVAFLAQQLPPAPEQAKLMLWVMFIMSVSIYEDHDQDWLQEAMEQSISSLGLCTWEDTKDVLANFLWIDVVFDEPGERWFKHLSRIVGSKVGV